MRAAERVRCEFALIRYVPDPVKGEFVNIGVLLRGVDGAPAVRFTRDWSRVRCLHADADTEMLEALETELSERLRLGVDERVNAKDVMATLEDSLSNSVQMSAMRPTLAESVPAEMEQLLRMYVEPVKAPRGQRRVTGRTALAGQMRDAFARAGVWDLMRKRVPASEYTRAGDPLKIDCGYRNGGVRLFHAVSLEADAELAKSLAWSLAGLREGVRRVEGKTLELTAVVEPVAQVSDGAQYGFGVGVMESAGLRVLTAADLGRVAEAARREMGL